MLRRIGKAYLWTGAAVLTALIAVNAAMALEMRRSSP